MRLYGGAQYHRAMAEFRIVVGRVKCQTISREEIVNACGVEDIHDGTNYIRYTSLSLCIYIEPLCWQMCASLCSYENRLLKINA